MKPAVRKRGVLSKVAKYRIQLLMLAPAVLFFLVFSYTPMVGIIIAFKKFDYTGGVFGSPWAAFENFRYLLIGGTIFKVIRNTVLYNTVFIVVNNTVEIAVAVTLMELAGRTFRRVSQSLMLLPYFISWVVVGAFVYSLFNNEFGLTNSTLRSIGMQPVNIYNKPFVWALIIVFFSLWKNMGYGMVLYIAAIAAIDRTLYEAAEIDGANVLQRIRHITLSSLVPTVIILVLLSIGNIFRGDFSMFYQIVGDNSLVYSATDVIDTFVVRSLLQVRDFGMTAAAGLVQSVLCFLIINIANYTIRRANADYSLF